MNILIIDDSSERNAALISCLSRIEIPFSNKISCAKNLHEANELILDIRPELVVFNLDMLEGSEILEKLELVKYCLVIMSEKQNLLTKVLDQSKHCYHLESPYNENDLEEVIMNLYLNQFESSVAEITNDERTINDSLNKISVSSSKKIIYLEVKDIVYCKASRQYTEIYLCCGKTIVSSKTLSHFQEKLKTSDFLRIHRSFLINLNHVSEYHRQSDNILLSNNNSIKLSYNMKENFLEKMSEIG